MDMIPETITYPRRLLIRKPLQGLIRILLAGLTHIEVTGKENLPKEGPLLVVGNHFSFLDPVALIGLSPWPIEFIGGLQTPNAPKSVSWLARLYGVLPVRRGGLSRETLLAAQSVLDHKGVLGIFPEAGSWATVLRPARPGTALLATRTKARLLPIGFNGLTEVFPRLRKGGRAHVQCNIGKPFGPFFVSERGTNDRKQLEEIGHEIMLNIASLITPETRGHYSDDPAVRNAAKGTEIYPWDNLNPES